MSLRQKAAKGMVWSALSSWGSQAISFIVFLVLARLLNPEVFGLIALSSVFISFIQIFVDQGTASAIIQRQDLKQEHLDTAFWINVLTGFALTVGSVLIAPLMGEIFKQPQLIIIIRWLSLSFLFNSLIVTQSALLTRKLDFKALSIRTLTGTICGGLAGISMAYLGFGVWSLVGQQLVSGSIMVITLWGISSWRPRFNISLPHYKELFNFGINDTGFQIFNFFSRRGDDLLIGYFLGPVALGHYTVAYRILLVMSQLLMDTTSKVALPTFSKLQSEPERMRRGFYTATQLSSFVAFPAFLSVAVLAPEIVIVLFGKQWSPSIPVMQVLTFVGLLQSISYFNGSIFLAMGKPSWRLGLTVFNTIANVIAYALVLQWGIVAVASAFVVRAYLFYPIPVWMVYKLLRINLFTYLHQFVCPVAGSVAMVAIILATRPFLSKWMDAAPMLAILITLGAVTYALVIRWTAPKILQQVHDLALLAVKPERAKNT